VDCREDYCKVCYARMHQKGAMALHRVKPLMTKVLPVHLWSCDDGNSCHSYFMSFFKFIWKGGGGGIGVLLIHSACSQP